MNEKGLAIACSAELEFWFCAALCLYVLKAILGNDGFRPLATDRLRSSDPGRDRKRRFAPPSCLDLSALSRSYSFLWRSIGPPSRRGVVWSAPSRLMVPRRLCKEGRKEEASFAGFHRRGGYRDCQHRRRSKQPKYTYFHDAGLQIIIAPVLEWKFVLGCRTSSRGLKEFRTAVGARLVRKPRRPGTAATTIATKNQRRSDLEKLHPRRHARTSTCLRPNPPKAPFPFNSPS